MSKDDKRRDFIMIKEMGANFVRLAHYPHHPYVMHLCDSLGLMVWSEIPVVNTVGRNQFIINAVDQMERLILRDYNHPSVIMWGVGNEYYRNFFTEADTEYALEVTRQTAAKAKALDPYRPTVQAQNDLVDNRILQLTDIQGRNRYFGWYGNESYRDFEPEMLKEHRAHPDWKLLVSEYGAEGKYGYHVNNPVKFDHSLTYQLALHRTYWETIKKHDFIMGGALWNMFDFASWAKVGNIPHINQKGTATYDRRPKGLYYYYQSEWTDKPMVYIWEHTLIHRYGQPNTAHPVEIFSNCNEVELFVNGTSQGKRNKKDGYVWPVRFSEGRHELKAIGRQHGETVSWQMEMYYHHGENPNDYKEGKDVNDATRG
jgi:beta-galactosidase